MNKARSVKWMQWGKSVLAGIVLTGLAVAAGLYLGQLVLSPNWENAIRLVGFSGMAVVILTNPIYGLLLWVMLDPFGRFWSLTIRLPTGIPDLSLGRFSVAVLAIVWASQLAIGRKKMRRPTLVEISMAAFCVLAVPSMLSGKGGFNNAAQMMLDRFMVPFMVFVLAKNLYEEKGGLDRLGGTLAVIGLYLSYMVFYEQTTGQPLFYLFGRSTAYSRSLHKVVSLLGNPAFLGTVLGMVAPFALYKFLRERSTYPKAFYGLVFGATLLGNFLCYNRGAWLALAVGLLIMMFFEREYRRLILPLVLIALAVLVLRWQEIIGSAVVTERLTNTSSVTFRLTMVGASEQMVREHPIFGVGFDNFGDYYILYGGHWETLAYDAPTPHNSFLLVLTTMGSVVFIPYLLMFLAMVWGIGSLLVRARKDKSVDTALLVTGWAVLAVYVVSAATVDLFVNTFSSLVLFATMGTIMGYVSHMRSTRPALQEAQA